MISILHLAADAAFKATAGAGAASTGTPVFEFVHLV